MRLLVDSDEGNFSNSSMYSPTMSYSGSGSISPSPYLSSVPSELLNSSYLSSDIEYSCAYKEIYTGESQFHLIYQLILGFILAFLMLGIPKVFHRRR